jgi:hypothetical protein
MGRAAEPSDDDVTALASSGGVVEPRELPGHFEAVAVT